MGCRGGVVGGDSLSVVVRGLSVCDLSGEFSLSLSVVGVEEVEFCSFSWSESWLLGLWVGQR